MKNTLPKSVFVLWAAISITPPPAHAFIVNDPSHMAKTVMEGAKRAAEAARQWQMEYNQYLQMLRDAASLSDPVFKPIGDTLRAVHTTYMQTQSLLYQAQNIDSAFGMMYPSYYTYLGTMGQGRSMKQSMADRYKALSDKGYMNTRNAMLSAGMRIDGLKTEQALLDRLIAQANSASGQKQALDAGNQIAGRMAEQMDDLRSLVAENTLLHANYMALQIEQKTISDAFSASYRKAPVVRGKGDNF